ncbi:transcription elongation factor SPT6-like [Haliotis cracherodii]|uniref:transcription elongation factor SPT6-like n=1 Tax=Haliotis cracherodii TaxID=6455 RepID=UPI0039EC320D
MSGFLEHEAEVSEGGSSSGDDSESEIKVVKKKKEKKKSRARISDDEEDDEDMDDERLIAEEMKDFINEDVEEEGEEESGDEGDGQAGKRKHDSDDQLDDQLSDDDYDLIEENLGIKVKRKQKLKRIRVMSDEDSDKEGDGEEDGKHMIEDELFEGRGDDDGDDMEERRSVAPRETEETNEFGNLDEEEEEESDVDDFIVDEEGKPISKGKKKKHIIHSDSALQAAQDIFGVDFDFEEFAQYGEEEDEEDMEEEVYEEEDEIEGEDGETRIRVKKPRKKASKKSIFEVFEPSELERGHFTDTDNQIRTTDMPERFQLRQIPVRQTEEGELEEEAEWIYKQAFTTRCTSTQPYLDQEQSSHLGGTNRRGPNMINKIRDAINFMRNQRLEVPFIAFYRKEYVEPELNINDLWKVWHYDEKWTQLVTRKKNLMRLFEKMQNYQFEENSDPEKLLESSVRPLTDDDIDRVKSVQTMEELRDVYQHFSLYYGHDIVKMRNAEKRKQNEENAAERGEQDPEEAPPEMIKQASRKSGYSICQDAKLGDLASHFGLTPEQFGENLRDNYQRHEVDQCPIEPSEMAKDYVCSQFATEEDVLMGARHMVAMQIAHDPLVRQSVRQTYSERAKLIVVPSKKGMKEIDEGHSCYTLKYVRNKPVKDLRDEQFLRLTQAEEEGLLTLSISIDEEGSSVSTYFEEVRQLYYKDEFSHLVQQWNIQRSEALKRALTKILYPQMEKELRTKLLAESKDGIVKACSRKLYNWLKVAPYQVDQQLEDDYDYDDNHGVKVLGVAFSTDRDSTAFGALIDGDGEVTDFIRLEHILKRRNAWRQMDRDAKESEMEKLKDFISTKKPHVVAVTAESRDALRVIEDIKQLIGDLEQEEQMAPISVELMDNELAMVYEASNKSQAEFREYPPVLRHAVSVARRLQDPLVEFAQLCNADEDILCLKYHPQQDSVSKEDLLNSLYLEFVNRVNEVGVDVNEAITHSHTSSLVQFICGLGPRKGSNLLKVLKQNNQRLENRTQLVSLCSMGPKVFINCAGFIKIDTNSLGDSTDNYVDVLDASRVHPEAYEWARKMAVDALEYDDTAEDANPAGALEEILESPERLKDLDLDAFAEELERQGYGDKHITLYDIRAELNQRYKDLRTPYRSPTNEERFNMITKETPETFYVGKLVMCTVTGIAHKRPQGDQLDQANPVRNDESGLWQCPFCQKDDFPELSEVWSHFDAGNCPGAAVGVKTRLDNSVTGFIPTKMISDKQVKNPEERVQVGMTIHTRITKIDIDRFQVDMTCKSSDLHDKEGTWKPQRDVYYDCDVEKKDIEKEQEKKKQQARQTYIKRVIVHPSFHNIGYKECEKLMVNMDQGDVIIRPSSKGANHLTCTWKVADDIMQHIDIREEGKENDFSLGRSLWIAQEEFEDLDEIIARHIQPMAAYVRDIVGFKYYRDAEGGKREILDKLLIEEKKKAPSRIPYYFSVSKQYPGKFLLSYLPRTKPRHEYFSVTAEGLKYRTQIFHSINSLIRWFKEHFRDPIPGTPASSRTPMVSSAYPTPSINLQNVDPATIQRAAAVLPNNIYNTLAQVANATPQQFGANRNFAGAYSGGFGYQQPTPLGMTPLVTPSYHGQIATTPGGQPINTPSYNPTPRTAWPPTTPRTPARTPQHRTTPGQTTQRMTPRPTPSTPAATDWAKAAEMWAKRKQDSRKPTTPRSHSSPRVRPSPSPMLDSSPDGGDATPLIDER